MYSSVDTIWVLLGALLVFFMQAGFAMVETGFTRAKNAGNIIMKNLMDFAIGTIVFWIIGFGIMFGASKGGFIGTLDFFVKGNYDSAFPGSVFLIFQTVFCATAATIVSGAMAERTKFISYCAYSLLISAIIYPISGHWIWNDNGWLAAMGFHDFAGSTAVHMVGGVAALVGAKILGPRIGKYGKDGKSNAILGHSLTLGALGVFILWFCWFGFNGASTTAASTDEDLLAMGSIFVNTNMAAACATVTTMIITWVRYKKPDVSMTLNGSLAGLVAITAGCDQVSITGAAAIGVIAGFIIVFGVEFIDKVLKIDDPVGAIAVHGFCGASGTILTGIFSLDGGLLYGGGFKFLGIQILGVFSVIVWVGFTMALIFTIIKKTIGLRVSAQEEINGLDIEEHGLSNSYADFMLSVNSSGSGAGILSNPLSATAPENAHIDDAVTVEHRKADISSDVKLTKIDILTKQSKLEELKAALNALGITGMTVTNVLGYGMQKGNTTYYRGIELDVFLLPKVRLEMVVCKVPVTSVVETAKQVLYTGNYGDGKIFVYDVENVIKVRTGEEGYEALQDDE